MGVLWAILFTAFKWLVGTTIGRGILYFANSKGIYPERWVGTMIGKIVGTAPPGTGWIMAGIFGLLCVVGWDVFGTDTKLRDLFNAPVVTQHPESSKPVSASPAPSLPVPPPVPPSQQPLEAPSDNPPKATAPTEADKAAAEYIQRSTVLYKEKIRQNELKPICDQVTQHFHTGGWKPDNQITLMIDTNQGDGDPYSFIEKQYPNTPWMAVRILAAFPTLNQRPMFLSYVFIGRVTVTSQIVGVYDETKQWRVLTEGSPQDSKYYDVMVSAVESERDRLLAKIAVEIQKLK
jgi:hypothetical protein